MSELNNDVTPLIFGRPKPEQAAPPGNPAEPDPAGEATGEFGASAEAVEQPAAEPADEAADENLESAAELYEPVAEQPAWLWPGAAETSAETAHDAPDESDSTDDAVVELARGEFGDVGSAEEADRGGAAVAEAESAHSEFEDVGSAEGVGGGISAVAEAESGWLAAADGEPGNADDALAEPTRGEFGDVGSGEDAGGGGAAVADAEFGSDNAVTELARGESGGAESAPVAAGLTAEHESGGAGGFDHADTAGAAEVTEATEPEELAVFGEAVEPDADLWSGTDDADEPVAHAAEAEAVADGFEDTDDAGTGSAYSSSLELSFDPSTTAADAGEAPSAYGHPEVDAVVERLAELDQLDTADHIEVYEDAHHRLHAALLAAGKDEGGAADAPSDYA
ncbi:hypothetical protein [Flindersiella endophytica]